jgi:hypothetical protein
MANSSRFLFNHMVRRTRRTLDRYVVTSQTDNWGNQVEQLNYDFNGLKPAAQLKRQDAPQTAHLPPDQL